MYARRLALRGEGGFGGGGEVDGFGVVDDDEFAPVEGSGGGAAVGAFVVFCSDAFLGRPLKCFVRVRGLKTSVRALHHTLCSEHEN